MKIKTTGLTYRIEEYMSFSLPSSLPSCMRESVFQMIRGSEKVDGAQVLQLTVFALQEFGCIAQLNPHIGAKK